MSCLYIYISLRVAVIVCTAYYSVHQKRLILVDDVVVVEIFLPYNMKGPIPSEIGNLTNMRKF